MTCGEHGGPICQVAGASARCDMLRSSTRSRACLALWSSCEDSCTHRCMAHRPARPFSSSLRFSCSSISESTCTGSGALPVRFPFCYTKSKFRETLNLKVNSFDNDANSFDLTSSGLESISCWESRSPSVICRIRPESCCLVVKIVVRGGVAAWCPAALQI